MGFSSLHVCMESSDHWLQGTIEEESGMDSSSPSGEMLACSRPLIERRLRPPHDQALKCPRCDSTHTKFCYYNNYSLSQPRYFCKTCRRYWTKGGTLRNIPVGGGCRKNKKISNKNKSNNNNDHQPPPLHPAVTNITSPTTYLNNPKHPHPHHLQLASFPDVQFSHHHLMLDNPIRPIDFMESKLEGIIGSTSSSTNFNNFMGNSDSLGMVGIGIGDMNINAHHHHHHHNLTSGFGGMSMNMMTSLDGGGNNINVMESCQRLMLPYDASQDQSGTIDVKPNPKLLSLEWQDQNGSCSDVGKDSFGYLNGLGSWTGMINGYGSSTTTNPPLV